MGCHDNITATKFPKQGSHLGKRVLVLFHFGPTKDGLVRDEIRKQVAKVRELRKIVKP